MIKLADTLVPMADFPAVMAEHTEFADGESLQEKLDNGSLGGDGAIYKQLSQAEYDALSDDEKMNGKEYRTYDTGHIYKLGIEYGKDGVQISDNETVEDKTWSSKKTSDEIAEVETELNAKVDKTDIATTIDSTSTDTQVPSAKSVNDKYEEANVYKGKYVGDLNDIPFIKSGVVYKYDIRSGNCTNTPVGTHGILYSTYFDSDNYCLQEFHSLQTNKASIYRRDKGTGVWSGWQEIATKTVTTLAELGLTSSATVDDVHDKLAVGQMAILQVRAFDNYQTLFPYADSDDQYARIEIQKGKSTTHSRIFWWRKDGSKFAVGNTNSNNKLAGWNEYALKSYVDSKIADLQAQINALK